MSFWDPFGLEECKQRGNCTQSEDGKVLSGARETGLAMQRADAIQSTEVTPLFLFSGAQAASAVGAVATKTVIAGTKALVRKELGSLALEKTVEKGVRGVLGSGRGQQWGVEATEGGGAMVHRYVAGGDGKSSAIYTYLVDGAGKVKGMLQRGFDAAGNVTHFDPK